MRTEPSVFASSSRRVQVAAITVFMGISAALIAATAPAQGLAEGESRSASPELGRVPVSAQFRFPDDFKPRHERTTIICQVLVGRRGDVSARKCAQHGGSDRLRAWLRNEVHYRMERASFRPALRHGEPVAVSMPLRVVVSCDGSAHCGVAVYPNAGQYTTRLGDAYYAPQEIVQDAGTWYDRLVASEECLSGKARICKEADAFAFGAAVKVNVDGVVTGVGRLAGLESGDFPVEAAFAHLVESRYIPAQFDGAVRELLIHTPTIHSRSNRHFRRNQCRQVPRIGTRIGRECFTMQAMAALRPQDESGFAENLAFWLVGAGG